MKTFKLNLSLRSWSDSAKLFVALIKPNRQRPPTMATLKPRDAHIKRVQPRVRQVIVGAGAMAKPKPKRNTGTFSMILVVAAVLVYVMGQPQQAQSTSQLQQNAMVVIPKYTVTPTPFLPENTIIPHGTCPGTDLFMPMYGQDSIEVKTLAWKPGDKICIPEWKVFRDFIAGGETDAVKIKIGQNFSDYVGKEAYIGYHEGKMSLSYNLVEALKASFVASLTVSQPADDPSGQFRHGYLRFPDLATIQTFTDLRTANQQVPATSNTVITTQPMPQDLSDQTIRKGCEQNRSKIVSMEDCIKVVTDQYNALPAERKGPGALATLITNYVYTPPTPTPSPREVYKTSVETGCAQAKNPSMCTANVLADIDAKGVVTDTDVQLLIQRHLTDAEEGYTQTQYMQMGDVLCEVGWEQSFLTLGEVMNGTGLGAVVRQKTTTLSVLETGDFYGQALFAWAPVVDGKSPICFFINGGRFNVDGKGATWAMSASKPGSILLGTKNYGGHDYVIGDSTIRPVYFAAEKTSVPAPYIPTVIPEWTPLSPDPTATRLPTPACTVVDWSTLITGGAGYTTISGQGDVTLQTNGWASDSAIGLQVEWIGTGSGLCYYITNIPKTVYANASDNSSGTWHYDSHGATITLGGPGYPGNVYEGKVQGASAEVWVFAINK